MASRPQFARLRGRLERAGDDPCATCGGILVTAEAADSHNSILRCASCGRHRGWLPTAVADFFSKTVRLFGVPNEPFLIRDASQTTPDLKIGKWGNIEADEKTGKTSKKGCWAGGDVVRGGATVILAMGDARIAARSIDEYLKTGIW